MICGKESFPTKTAVLSQINAIQKSKSRRAKFGTAKSYFCRDCNAWHITSRVSKSRTNKAVKAKVKDLKQGDKKRRRRGLGNRFLHIKKY